LIKTVSVKCSITDDFCKNQCNPLNDIIKTQMLKTHFNAAVDFVGEGVRIRPKINDGQLIVLENQTQLVPDKEVDNICISVLLPSCNEEGSNLKNTINSLVMNAVGEVEVLVGLDGGDEETLKHPSVFVKKFPERIGKRRVLNSLAAIASGSKFFVLDSHCGMTKGWDRELKKYHLKNSLLQCTLDSLKTLNADGTLHWKGKGNRYDFCFLDTNLRDKWWLAYPKRLPKDWLVTESMGLTGCGFLIDKDFFYHLGRYNEEFGVFRGAEGPEWSCKVWLSGGMILLHKNVICAHLFKKKEPYSYSMELLKKSYALVKDCFWNKQGPNQIFGPEWLAKRFMPVPKWEEYFASKQQ
jgi:hypothetical protein